MNCKKLEDDDGDDTSEFKLFTSYVYMCIFLNTIFSSQINTYRKKIYLSVIPIINLKYENIDFKI
jgi:hypothetical protein